MLGDKNRILVAKYQVFSLFAVRNNGLDMLFLQIESWTHTCLFVEQFGKLGKVGNTDFFGYLLLCTPKPLLSVTTRYETASTWLFSCHACWYEYAQAVLLCLQTGGIGRLSILL